MTLPLTIPHAGGAHCQQESALQSRRTFADEICEIAETMMFADKICEVAETKTTYITDKLN